MVQTRSAYTAVSLSLTDANTTFQRLSHSNFAARAHCTLHSNTAGVVSYHTTPPLLALDEKQATTGIIT